MGAATTSKPEAGDYLTNGTRLVMVMAYTKTGALRVEDACTLKVDTLAEWQDWRVVKRGKRG